MTEQSQQIALYQGVNVEKAAYMAAFSQAGGLQSIIDQITQQALVQAEGLDASTPASRGQQLTPLRVASAGRGCRSRSSGG